MWTDPFLTHLLIDLVRKNDGPIKSNEVLTLRPSSCDRIIFVLLLNQE